MRLHRSAEHHWREHKRLSRLAEFVHKLGERFEHMSKFVQDYVTSQKAFQARQAKAIDDIIVDFKSLTDKVKGLEDRLNDLDASDEDKAALTQVLTDSSSISDKLDELDKMNAPSPDSLPGAADTGSNDTQAPASATAAKAKK